MKTRIRSIISIVVLIAFIWIGIASSKDEEIFTLKASVEFAGDSIIITNNDSFVFDEYSITLVLPGGVQDVDASYNYYTVDLPINIGESQSIALSEIKNINQKKYPNLVVPESASLTSWYKDKIGIINIDF